jgi:hypothetical protein
MKAINQFAYIRQHLDQLFLDYPTITFAQMMKKYPIEDTPSHGYNFMQMVARVVHYNERVYPCERVHQHTLELINTYNQLTSYATKPFWEEIDATIHYSPTHPLLMLVTQLYSHIDRIQTYANRVYSTRTTEETRDFYLKSIKRWNQSNAGINQTGI